MQLGPIDLNADVGEGSAGEARVFASGVTSANIACGAHAGDAATMAEAFRLSALHRVSAGAHPGYLDRAHFGRREIGLDAVAIGILAQSQIQAALQAARSVGLMLAHVKPHGALYHRLAADAGAAAAFVEAARLVAPQAHLFGPPVGALAAAARAAGVSYVPEGFIDRGYAADGTLLARGQPGALIEDEATAVAQSLDLARSGRMRTLCAHGDGATACRLLAAVRRALLAEGFTIAAP